MKDLTPIDLKSVIDDVKAEGKSRRVLWQDSESIAFLSSGRKERWDFHIDPADEVTLQLTGVQHLVYRTAEGKEQTADIKAGQILLCPAGVPHSPQNFWVGSFECPQPGQVRGSRAPHSPQNLRFPSFGSPQAAQSTEATIALSPIRGTSATRTLGS